MSLRSIFCTLFGALLLSPLAAPAFAQQADAEESYAIEEIVVTATKREQSLQDVPIAVTAFSTQQIQEDNLRSLHDIGKRTPGLMFATFSTGQPEIAIRGIGSKEDGAAASDSTLVAIDGVYIAARTATVTDIFDLERIEVLRGPQGTLFGKNSIGGIINFVTRKPSNEFRAELRQTFGDYGRLDTQGLINTPVTDNLFAKFSFSRRHHDGFIDNILVDEQQGERNGFAWRLQARWVPNDNVDILLSIDGADDDDGATNREPIGSQGPLHDCPCAANPVAVNEALGGADDPHDSLAETEGFLVREIRNYMIEINWDFGWATLTNTTAYRESDFDWLEDSEGLPPTGPVDLTGTIPEALARIAGPPETGFSFDVNDSAVEFAEQFTEEIRLTSPSGRTWEWVAGFFFSKEEIDRTETFQFTALGDFSLEPRGAQAVQEYDGTSVAGYGQVSYNFTDRFVLTAGGRFSYEKKEVAAQNIVLSSPVTNLLLQPFDRATGEEDWDNFSWKVSGQWFARPDLMIYATAATGFKSGGFTGAASTRERAVEEPFNPEDALNIEGGFKGRFLDRRLQLNVTGFFTDYDDLQVTRFFQPEGGQFGEFITENAGSAELKGIEIETVARPARWIEFGGSYAYLDAEYTNFTGTPSVTGTGDFTGNTLRQAPEHSLSGWIKLSHQQDDLGEFSVKFSGRYQSKVFFDPDNNPINVSPGHEIFDLRAAWVSTDGHWEIAGWIENLTDEEYVNHGFTQRGSRIAFGLFGPPRTFGTTLSYTY